MRKGMIKSTVENKNEEVKGKSSEEKQIDIPKCIRKSHVENINEATKESSSEEEDIVIRKCRRRSLVDNINEEVKGCTSSLKQQEDPPEPTNNKQVIRLENMKRKVKRAAL